MNAVDSMKQRDAQCRRALQDIGSAIGYGNAQSILGELWDEMLAGAYGAAPGRGAMGVTIDKTRWLSREEIDGLIDQARDAFYTADMHPHFERALVRLALRAAGVKEPGNAKVCGP